MVSFLTYASHILSSNAFYLYSETDITSSLWDSSFLNSQSCSEFLQRDVIIDHSKVSVTSVFLFGVRSRPHFLEICTLRKFLQPILDCEAKSSFSRILQGTKVPLKGGMRHGVSLLSW
jgi:hypothetical protein